MVCNLKLDPVVLLPVLLIPLFLRQELSVNWNLFPEDPEWIPQDPPKAWAIL